MRVGSYIFALLVSITAQHAIAADSNLKTAVGGGLGAAAGTAVGQAVGGNTGGIVGGAVGGGVGGAVTTKGEGRTGAIIGGAAGGATGAAVGQKVGGSTGAIVGAGAGGAGGAVIGKTIAEPSKSGSVKQARHTQVNHGDDRYYDSRKPGKRGKHGKGHAYGHYKNKHKHKD